MIAGEKYLQSRIRLALAGALVLLTACSLAIPTAGPPAAASQPPFSPSHTPTPTPTPSPPQPTGTVIPFETIEKSDHGGTEKYNETGPAKAPRFILLTRAADVAKLDGLVSDQALEQARALDFGEDWAVAVFAGWKPSSGYEAEIVRVVSKDGQVVVAAVLRDPPPGIEVQARETLPYHLILLKKEGLIGKKTFSFEANGELIQRFEVNLSQR